MFSFFSVSKVKRRRNKIWKQEWNENGDNFSNRPKHGYTKTFIIAWLALNFTAFFTADGSGLL